MASKYDQLVEYIASGESNPILGKVDNWSSYPTLKEVMGAHYDWRRVKDLSWTSYNIKKEAAWLCERYSNAPVSEIAESLRRAATVSNGGRSDWNSFYIGAAMQARRAEAARAKLVMDRDMIASCAKEAQLADVYTEVVYGVRALAARLTAIEAKLDAALAAPGGRVTAPVSVSSDATSEVSGTSGTSGVPKPTGQSFLIPYEDSGDAS